MACVYSKPCWPLGCCVLDNKLRSIQPNAAVPECCVCFEPLRWCGFYDLRCGHECCAACMLGWLTAKIKSEGVRCAFGCPLCRASIRLSARVVDDALKLPGIEAKRPSSRVLHCLTDAFDNWTVVAVESDMGVFLRPPLPSKQPAFERTQTCWLNPYSGWIVPDGRPRRDLSFRVEAGELDSI